MIGFEQRRCSNLLGCDVSQSMTRTPQIRELPEAGGWRAPTLLPGTEMIVCGEFQRPILGYEGLMGIGFPLGKMSPILLQNVPDSLLASLAGNAFSGFVILPVLCSLLVAADWANGHDDADLEPGAADDMFAIFNQHFTD